MEVVTLEQYQSMLAAEDAARGRTNTRRAAAGAKAKAVGDSFQTVLNAHHAALLRSGRFYFIEETKPPMRPIKVAGKLYYVLLPGGGPCDYLFHMASGVGGSFDAKTTDKVKTFSWPEKRLHQLGTLRRIDETSRRRCAAFALVEWRRFGEVRLHPIWTIPGVIVRRELGVVVEQGPDGPAWERAVVALWGQ